MDAIVISDQRQGAGVVANFNTFFFAGFRQGFNQSGPSAIGLHGQTTPELELAVYFESLFGVEGHKPHTFALHPLKSQKGLGN